MIYVGCTLPRSRLSATLSTPPTSSLCCHVCRRCHPPRFLTRSSHFPHYFAPTGSTVTLRLSIVRGYKYKKIRSITGINERMSSSGRNSPHSLFSGSTVVLSRLHHHVPPVCVAHF